jgi:cytochrome c551/c552
MKSLVVLATAAAFAVGLSGPVLADEGTFKSAGCAKCHDPEKKKKGAPSVKDMQGKFKGDKGKVDSLTAVVVKGKDHPEVDAKEPEVKKAMAFAIGAK